jgi:hypothetical protein
MDAREAVSELYGRRGVRIHPHRIVLTASTSEAYSLLFKLFCGGGDAVLTPVPSYPLFDHLARLDDVRQRPYALSYHGAWTLDLPSLDAAWAPDVRVVLAVSPNNPTGSVLGESDADALAGRCADRDAALVVDEVFAEYPIGEAGPAPRTFDSPSCLLCRLGGLSKTAALPQVKLGWIAVDGPERLVEEALDRLELICDTYLSVSTPVQRAARRLIGATEGVRDQIRERVRLNHRSLIEMAKRSSGISVLAAEAGWSGVLRVPATRSEETIVRDLMDTAGVVVQPGYFFDFPHEAFVVVSLLTEPALFSRGLVRLVERLDEA